MISDEDFIFLLEESHGCKKALEIGTGTGKSSAALKLNCEVYSIDRNDIMKYNVDIYIVLYVKVKTTGNNIYIMTLTLFLLMVQ